MQGVDAFISSSVKPAGQSVQLPTCPAGENVPLGQFWHDALKKILLVPAGQVVHTRLEVAVEGTASKAPALQGGVLSVQFGCIY